MNAVGAAADINHYYYYYYYYTTTSTTATTTTTTTTTTIAITAVTTAKMIIITKIEIIKNKKDKIDVRTNSNITQKEAEKETKIQECMYRGTINVGHEMYDQTSNKWSHRTSNIF